MRNKKGQIAIEYIILISILLLFFQAIIYPNVNFSENMVQDIHGITQTKQSIDKLSNDLSSFVSSSGYGKRLVYFYLPTSSKIICDGTTIDYNITISSQSPQPNISNCRDVDNPNTCYFSKQLFIGSFSLNCPADGIGPGYNGYLEIEKTSAGVLNVEIP